MKSFFIWFFAMLAGGALGYALSFYLDVSFYFLIAGGIILGSSVGITINIHRGREEEHVFNEMEYDLDDSNEDDFPSDNTMR